MTLAYHGARCFITGSNGFIGRALGRRLVELGAQVQGLDCALDRGDDGLRFNGVCDQDELRNIFTFLRPQYVFHLAAQTEVLRSYAQPLLTYEVNVRGTLLVLEACREFKTPSVVIASSDKAYGYRLASDLPYREDQPLARVGDVYSCSKRLADLLAGDYASVYGLPLRVLRCVNIYGPGQTNYTTLIASTLRDIARGRPPRIYKGCATVKREWLYLDDAVDAYLLAGLFAAATVPGAGMYAYNVGSGEVFTVRQVVAAILEASGKASNDYVEEPASTGSQPDDQYVDSAIWRLLFPGWTARPLATGLADLFLAEGIKLAAPLRFDV